MPERWVLYNKHGRMPAIYKKDDRTDCGNNRGIFLLSIAGKIFARILLNRLSTHITPAVVPETQCGFRGNRSTVDMIVLSPTATSKVHRTGPNNVHGICRVQ